MVESGKYDGNLIVFVCQENDFVARQYINKICSDLNLQVDLIDDVYSIARRKNPWEIEGGDLTLRLFSTDSLEELPQKILEEKNVVIITKKVSKDVRDIFMNYIVEIPKLENWQVKEYAYSIADGVNKRKLDWFLDLCKYNIDRIDQELSKISIFDKSFRDNLFDKMVYDGAFDDIQSISVFDLSNALCVRDLSKIAHILENISNVDINEFGFLAILINAFKNLACVQLSKSDSELKDLSSKQIYAIKKLCGRYSAAQLENILRLLYSIDYRVKSGELDSSIMIEYIVDKILTM